MYFIHLDSPENISKEEKDIFVDMYYFFLKNKRKIPPVIQSIKKGLDDRDSVYDIFKSAELVGDYIHWKIPEDFFKSFFKELSEKIKVNLVKLQIFEGDELLFHFSNRIEFEELHNEMVARAISLAEHLNLNRSAVKKTFKSKEKFFYPYTHTKIILWKISPKLSGIVVLAFDHDEYNNTDIFENFQSFFRQFGSLIQKFQENDFQLNKRLDFIVGKSTSMKNLKQQILQVSKVDFSLLISGESGSGKELVAKAVHLLSKRSKKPFVTVNSAAIPEYLLEAELFGYKAGAFTGATDNRMGLIESADSGTLFLDEIADLPIHLQAKLLRVLQENEIRRLGENEIRKVDIRLISATNRDLDELIKIEHFREDLFFRIQDLTIRVPNLKQREDDIELLIRYFFNRYGFVLNDESEFQGIVEEFKQKTWKGNVRELESHIKRLITFYPGGETKKNVRQQDKTGLKIAKANFEKSLIIKTLSENNWHKAKSAKQLKISRVYLFELIKKYNIQKTVN
jgi:transcriptional regulator with PAS, ATPase and Fis domain